MRARELGLRLRGRTGRHNAITDVAGVEVGYTTLIEGDDVRTGVTAILPRGKADFDVPCIAEWFSLNGNGEMTGTTLIRETGQLRLPVLITNTHAVGPCHRGVIEWVAREKPRVAAQWLLPVVAETYDGYLNDTNGAHVQASHAIAAIDAACSGPIAEGSVGGGTGMNCYAFKGGSGTSSRVVEYGRDIYTVGAFVQANFGARNELTICGVPVGEALGDDNPIEESDWKSGAGSVIAVIATDAPFLPGQCAALARRVPMGLARTGTTGSHFSGDIFLAFSTANVQTPSVYPVGDPGYDHLRHVPWNRMDDFFAAVVYSIEEAVLNALLAAETMTGRLGRRSPALPKDRLAALLS
ncbi:P1 family peptidase [Pendulispora albinea]|uniref:P1 family peptidase n=1 Tax=Pendulispora albinea TaxID=2741071 RepID=A0ABZ2LUP5_9BACT